MKLNHTSDVMTSKVGSSHGKKSSLSRASSSRRKHGRAVTIEDVLDSEDHLHRVSGTSTPGMEQANEEVSPEWYALTEGEPRTSKEAIRDAELPAQVSCEESDTTEKLSSEDPVSGDPASGAQVTGDLAMEEELKVTSNVPGENQHVPSTDVASTFSTAATARDASPALGGADKNHDEEAATHEAGRPPGLQWAETPRPRSHRFQSPMAQWAHPHGHGQPYTPHFRPIFPPPLPQVSPPLFGMPHPPPMMPGRQVSRFEPGHLSGYELLASRLSGGQESELPIPPIYRRFKRLHNRILLELQDDIVVLEERLRYLDEQDSINRGYRDGGVRPASRRQDKLEPNEVTTARKLLLEQIAQKMYQFSTQLDGYKKVCEFRDAMPEDVHDYRSFLAAHAPVIPDEIRFLDKTNDLLCLPDAPYYVDEESVSGHQTPAPRTPRLLEAPMAPSTISMSALDQQAREYTGAPPRGAGHARRMSRPLNQAKLRHMAVGICMAIILPILSFPVISGFVSRITVVALVGLGMAVVGVQSGAYDVLTGRASAIDGAIALGIYVGFMAIVAATFG